MPVIENPGFGTSFVQGFGETAIPSLQKALAQYLEEQRQRKAFDDFMAQTTTTRTVPAPTSPAIPPPLGSLLPNQPVRGVETQTQEQLPITDPRFLQAAQQYGIASPEGLKQFLGLRQMTMPQYPQAEIPAYGSRITYKTDPNGGPPVPVREDFGQAKPVASQANRYFLPRMENGKPVTQQFGNMTRTIEDEYDRTTNQKTGVWRYGEGGAQSVTGGAGSTGAWVQTKDAMGRPTGFINKLTNEVKPLSEFQGAEGLVGAPLSSTTKTMIETAPKVKELIDRLSTQIDAASKDKGSDQLGPLAGRWNAFMTGKVGAANPAFNKIRTNAGLLSTLLMRMHVGARGSEKIMEKFDNLLGIGYQSPENLKAALGEIGSYADAVESEKAGISPAGKQEAPATHRYNPQTGKIEAIK